MINRADKLLSINNSNSSKYSNIFHKTINNILTKHNITFSQFTGMLFDAMDRNNRYINYNKSVYRNNTLKTIFGSDNLTFNRFKFIMEEVLKEPIPDDPEIIHLSKLGRGKDLRGQIFGRLTVIEYVGIINGNLRWKCKCSNIIGGVEKCGNETVVNGRDLLARNTTSCGCYQRECNSINHMTHGKEGTIEYMIWSSMLQRCINKNYKQYHRYGGRGITVCDRWLNSFENFYADMGDRPEGMSIDRRDNDGNYEPSNCRWATKTEQSRNRCNNLKFDDGTVLKDFIYENNIPYRRAIRAYYKGLTKAEILSTIN